MTTARVRPYDEVLGCSSPIRPNMHANATGGHLHLRPVHDRHALPALHCRLLREEAGGQGRHVRAQRALQKCVLLSSYSFPSFRMLDRPRFPYILSIIDLVPTPPLRFICATALQSGGLLRSMASSPRWAATPSTSSPSSPDPSESAVRRLIPPSYLCAFHRIELHVTREYLIFALPSYRTALPLDLLGMTLRDRP